MDTRNPILNAVTILIIVFVSPFPLFAGLVRTYGRDFDLPIIDKPHVDPFAQAFILASGGSKH